MISSAKIKLKNAIMQIAPSWGLRLFAIKSRRFNQLLLQKMGYSDLNEKIISLYGCRVLDGPFRNLCIPESCKYEQLGPYIFGTYEQEIQSWIHELSGWDFKVVIDIGSKFGYYAAGFARVFPKTKVIAFDVDPWSITQTRLTATLNDCNNLIVSSFCSPEWLVNNSTDSLIISDCEGFESNLFTDITAAGLKTATLIIETHEHLVPGQVSELCRCFSETHHLSVIAAVPRSVPSWDKLGIEPSALTDVEIDMALNEMRPAGQKWIYMRPLAR